MPAPKGSRNAAHGESSYDQRLQVPVSADDKARYVSLAQRRQMKLSALVRELLEKECKKAKI